MSKKQFVWVWCFQVKQSLEESYLCEGNGSLTALSTFVLEAPAV